jgi:Mn2+/Fe2+ NRAMP family transporter
MSGANKPLRSAQRFFFSELGPGIVAGAALGTSLLWTTLISWPLMAAVQFMCARIGMVTGRGLAGAFHHKLPRPLIAVVACALFIANTINVGADLSGMADAAQTFTGINSHYLVFVFGIAIAFATIQFRYHQIANILKWLALVLFAYVITALIVGPNWKSVLHDTFIPSLPHGLQGWQTLVAILGTTIGPYLFFWQTSQEVEEEKAACSALPLACLSFERCQTIFDSPKATRCEFSTNEVRLTPRLRYFLRVQSRQGSDLSFRRAQRQRAAGLRLTR